MEEQILGGHARIRAEVVPARGEAWQTARDCFARVGAKVIGVVEVHVHAADAHLHPHTRVPLAKIFFCATAVHPGQTNIIASIGTISPIASTPAIFKQCLVNSIVVSVGTPSSTTTPPEDATHFTPRGEGIGNVAFHY